MPGLPIIGMRENAAAPGTPQIALPVRLDGPFHGRPQPGMLRT